MKNRIILFILVAVGIISCNKNKTAEINYTREIDFGTIKAGDTINKIFQIKNTSSNVLHIRQIKTSCGCTVADLKDSVITENSSTEVKVQFVAEKENIGKVRKSIIFDANTNPNFTVLYLKGNVAK